MHQFHHGGASSMRDRTSSAAKAVGLRIVQFWQDLDPVSFCLGRFEHLKVLPETIAERVIDALDGKVRILDMDLFRFVITELVNNCYLSLPEKLFRSQFGDVPFSDREEAIHQVIREWGPRPVPRESLRLRIAEGSSETVFRIESDVSPAEVSLTRITQRLQWTPEKIETFLASDDGVSGSYASITGMAGMGIYMVKREIERSGGTLRFSVADDAPWSGFEVTLPRS